MQKSISIFFFLLSFIPNLLLGQKEGPVSKIENPREFFGDERQDWVGKVIFYLRCDHVQVKNPYFDWYYNPYKLDTASRTKWTSCHAQSANCAR